MEARTLEDFFDTEYRNYALYTISSRAIPHLMDGFKPAQRKIAFAANKLWKTGNEKFLKVFQLGGQAAALSFFHHGSLDQTIIGMTQTFKNSMPIFQGDGQFGSLRAQEAGAPRYVGVKFNENFHLLYKDFNLTTPQTEDGEEIEPKYFLPIIPTVLLNGGSGIAVGFASNILNRHPMDLIRVVRDVLHTGSSQHPLKPWVDGFSGEVLQGDSERQWRFLGAYTVKGSYQVEVTEIPPGYTYEKYEQHLEGLVEKGVLHSYEDHSSDRARYTLRFPKADLARLVADNKLDALLNMVETETENLTVLDENGSLRVFGSALAVVQHFVAVRLGYYEKRKVALLESLAESIRVLEARVRFLHDVISGRMELGKVSREQAVRSLTEQGVHQVDGGYTYLLNMPIVQMTADKIVELENRLVKTRQERVMVEQTTAKDMYFSDLKELEDRIRSKYPYHAPPAPKAQTTSNMVRDWIGEGSGKQKDWMDLLK
jgi:DNA gyrase/topoisomerase IV subunit A